MGSFLDRLNRGAATGFRSLTSGSLFGGKTEEQHRQERENAARLQNPITASQAEADIPDLLASIRRAGGLEEEQARRQAISGVEDRGLGGGTYQVEAAQRAAAPVEEQINQDVLGAIYKRRGELEQNRQNEIGRLLGRRQLPNSFGSY